MSLGKIGVIVSFAACVYILVVTVAMVSVASIVPPFPFQNTQQLGPGIPGLAPFGDPELGLCTDGRLLMVFSFGTYNVDEGAHEWRIYVEMMGEHVTGTYFAGGTTPKAVYFGTANRENGHITITQSEPFDPAKHHQPCEEWK